MKQGAKVVTIGGGTGTFMVLSGLRAYPFKLSAIVTMADDGGSTGRLRDEFGVLPPGDLRQCLVALSDADMFMRALFNHRYAKGELTGHNFGNIFISTLEQVTGSLDKALEVAGDILKIHGRVIPVTLSKVRLRTELKNGKILRGEAELTAYQLVSKFGIKRMRLDPRPKANPKALKAIKEADLIIVGPGNLYSSIIPNFLVPGIAEAFAKSKARKMYIANLMNKHGQTDGFTVQSYVHELERVIGKTDVFDYVLYNKRKPAPALLRTYADEGEPVHFDGEHSDTSTRYIGADLLANGIAKTDKKDLLRRTLIRHDSKKIARLIAKTS